MGDIMKKMKELFEKNKNLVIGLVVLLICLIAAISYAFYQLILTQEDSNIITTKSGCFDIAFLDGDGVEMTNALPLSNAEGMEEEAYNFTIYNNCNGYAKYQINVEVMDTSNIPQKHIKVALDKARNIINKKPLVDTTVEGATHSYKLKTGWLEPEGEVTYDFRMWMDYATEIEDLPGINEGTIYSFSTKIVIIAVPDVEPNMLMVSEENPWNQSFLGSVFTRDDIASITFVDNKVLPGDELGYWDVSEAGDNSVIAWYKESATSNMYDIWIGAKGGVCANPDSSWLFSTIEMLESLDLTHFDVSFVTDASDMFYYTGVMTDLNLIGNLNEWDVSKVTQMNEMFYNFGRDTISFTLGDLSNWDVSNVINMKDMFYGVGYDSTVFTVGDLSNWDVGRVTNMAGMFSGAGKSSNIFTLGDLSEWNTSNVIQMERMFFCSGYNNSSFTMDFLKKWDVSNVTDMGQMLSSTGHSNPNFTLDLSNWDISSVSDMQYMFWATGIGNPNFILNLSNWDIRNVTNMNGMFNDTSTLVELRLDNWSEPVASKSSMFMNSNNRSAPDNMKIYVKDSAVESWIVTGTSFPSNAVVSIVP